MTIRLAKVPIQEVADAAELIARTAQQDPVPQIAAALNSEVARRRRIVARSLDADELRPEAYHDALDARTTIATLASQLRKAGLDDAANIADRLASDFSPLLTALIPPGEHRPVFACKR